MSDTTTALATSESPTSNAPPETGGDREAMLREAFPSMFPKEPPPATDAQSALVETQRTEPAATRDAPSAEPVDLAASGLAVTLPAGMVPDETLAAFDSAARDLHLDAAGAQRLVDLHHQAVERVAAEETAAWHEVTSGWRDAVKADKEIGGPNFDANVKLARQVLDTYGPGLKAELKNLGLGNHPEVIRLLVRVGRALPAAPASRTASTSPAAQQTPSREESYRQAFPSMFKK